MDAWRNTGEVKLTKEAMQRTAEMLRQPERTSPFAAYKPTPPKWRLRVRRWHTGAGKTAAVVIAVVILGFGFSAGFGISGYYLEAVTPWRRWYLWGVT